MLAPYSTALALPSIVKADRVLVQKSRRKLHLLRRGAVLRTYPVALGARPVGPKRRRGDLRTPEGVYEIDGRDSQSPYFLALHISYPNEADRARALDAGWDPGGAICLHGLPHGFERLDPIAFTKDWTEGCIAVSDRAIAQIWMRVDDGTPIEIRP